MIVARAGQLAESEAIQLTQAHPGLGGQIDATNPSCIQKLIRKPGRLLPGLLHCRREIFDHPISHRGSAGTQVMAHLYQVIGVIAPVDKVLTLVMRHLQPMAEFELDSCQIKFATNTKGNTSPGADEVLFECKTVPRLIKLRMHW